ncbi:hypothetical protein GCK32_001046 [Trichostrongylus colubriformis]|uniref:Methyltransferase domain-containing protein n=1 Tax=Trichostrongylus colubriformis TaxID=6319 RepID=A0AAN8FB90_TRICO
MRQGIAAVIAMVFCTIPFLLIYFDNRSTLKVIYGALLKSSQGVVPEAWVRRFYEKSAPARITYLSQGLTNTGTLYNILAPEVFCPYAVRIGSLDDGGKIVCNPFRMPWNCSIYSVGIASEVTFEEAIQEFNNYTCRIFGYEKENISSSTFSRYTRINGRLQQLEISSTTDPENNRYALGDLVERNNDKSVEFLKMDMEGGEHHFLIPFLERYKVCQVGFGLRRIVILAFYTQQIFVEIHDTAINQTSLLSRIAKLDYTLFSHEINAHTSTVCEFSFIHIDCMQAYGAYMLKRYLNSVTVPT